MSNYRIARVVTTVSARTASVIAGDNPVYGSDAYNFKQVWGIMVASGSQGYVSMSNGGGINLAHLSTGTSVPCYPSFVSCSTGTVYILA